MEIKKAIVKIYAQCVRPYHFDPWSMDTPESCSGSGCIIGGSRILTNAHVVSDQTVVQVRRHGDAKRHFARLLYVSHDADLALLTVDDPSFFDGVTPLEIGPLPRPQEEVLVYGFPEGGDSLSITGGIISRIEHQVYVHSFLSLLAVQIDAAINPGGSGGPAIIDGRVVGVVMQMRPGSSGIGYLVPSPVIRHFLKDVEDGECQGVPGIGIATQPLVNPDHRLFYGVPDNREGVLVVRVVPGSPADGIIEEKDVLLSIEGNPIAGDGTVEFRPRERTSFHYYVERKQIGERVELGVLRGGKELSLSVELTKPARSFFLVPAPEHDILPSYYIFGGLVFRKLTLGYLMGWGNEWEKEAPPHLLAVLHCNLRRCEDEEVVLLVRVLAANVNDGYHDVGDWIIERVNGRRVRNLKELIRIAEEGDSPFVVFENSCGEEIVLDRRKARESKQEILRRYHIPRDRSRDLVRRR